jgi:Suppressor of fused protein (SUFU)
MFEWVNKKKAEVTPGGSVVHRYPKKQWSSGRRGSPVESAAQFAEMRHEVYGRLFGEVRGVSEETRPLIPRVDVHMYARSGPEGRLVSTLVTSGMSDLEMNVPADANAPRRVELIFYCHEARQEYIETLRWLAHFPHDQRTWIGVGHTTPNGDPPAPFWGSSILDTVLFLPPIVKRDTALPEELQLDGEPVHFLWVVPLTTAECNLKLDRGVNALLDLFDKNRHPHVFDAGRASYA